MVEPVELKEKDKKQDKKPDVKFSLSELLFGQKTMEEVFIIGGHKIKVRTLTGAERREILERPSVRSATAIYDRIEFSRTPTLARSIVSFDDIPWASRDEVRKMLDDDPNRKLYNAIEEFLDGRGTEVLSLLYSLYLRVVMKERQAIDELKKDLPSLPTETGGESAGVSAIDLLTRLF